MSLAELGLLLPEREHKQISNFSFRFLFPPPLSQSLDKATRKEGKGNTIRVHSTNSDHSLHATATMLLAPTSRAEDSSAQLCRLILKSFGHDQFSAIRRIVNDNPSCINTPGSTGETPLYLAVNQRNTDLVKFLLVAKADANGSTSNGRTALHEIASTSSHATAKQDCELIDLLVTYNGSLSKFDANHSQPVDIARMYNAPDSVLKALALKPSVPTNIAGTPMHLVPAQSASGARPSRSSWSSSCSCSHL